MSYEIVAKDVGESGENVYQVYGTKRDCKNFYVLSTWAGIYEFDEDAQEFVSVDEGNIPSGIRRSSNEKVERSYIGMRYTFQRAPKLSDFATDQDCGWIDPKGRIYRIPTLVTVNSFTKPSS